MSYPRTPDFADSLATCGVFLFMCTESLSVVAADCQTEVAVAERALREVGIVFRWVRWDCEFQSTTPSNLEVRYDRDQGTRPVGG